MIKKISANKTYSIRKEILRKGIDLSSKFDGDLDVETFHLGAFQKEKLVGVASFMKRNTELLKDLSQYQLRGMATVQNVRGKGYGVKLLEQAIIILKNKKNTILWCNAREKAVQFYLKNDFKIIGEAFNISKIGKHYKMYKKISN